MYKIAICDDQLIFSDFLFKLSEKILKELCIPFSITIYSSCETLLDAISQDPSLYHLLLLDILMEGMNGMELAHKVRSVNESVTIVFTTSTPDFSLQGYEVRAFQYLLKPVAETKLKNIFEYDYYHTVQAEFFTLKSGNIMRQLPIKNILYLETQGRKVAVFLVGEMIYTSTKLGHLEQQLPPNRFVRCHQSFLINIENIVELCHSQAVTKDGKQIPISRACLQNVQKAFLKRMGQG